MSSSCSFVSDLAGLSGIHGRDVQVVVFVRKLSDSLFASQEGLASIGPFEGHAHLRVSGGGADAGSARFGGMGRLFPELDDQPLARALRRDVLDLSRHFARLSGSGSVHVSLEILDAAACRKWHTDRVGMRMLVTYAGPGTEWALASGVDRSWLGRTSLDLDAANDRIVFDRSAIRRAGDGDVLLCKGDRFVGSPGQGLVHRSPPVQPESRWRLLLRIDERGCGE